jgi:phosphoenolpyruvate synthase/pyruvate phosphate dikinase
MQVNLLASISEVGKEDTALVGGKASSLGEMTKIGLDVPGGFIITTRAYRQFSGAGLSNKLEQQILDEFDSLASERVSVRSSAVAEDSSTSSWAGQFESYLNVTRDELLAKIKDCWNSVEAASAYAEQQAGEVDMTMAVIIQKMVDSEVSGVAFSQNPTTKNDDEIMIEATYGLGELLVQGMVIPDNYLIKKASLEIINKTISPKNTKLVFSEGVNQEVSVPSEEATLPCLNDNQICRLSEVVINIENHYGTPQDIEWAFESDKFFILQSRPITA